MPLIKKSNLTNTQAQALLKTKSQKSTFNLSPTQKFAAILNLQGRRSKFKVRRFHFKAIEHNGMIFLFDGMGSTIDVINGVDVKTINQAREISRALFLETKEINRQGGYNFDFYRDNLVRVDLSLGFS